MDVLDNFKDAWKNQESKNIQFTEADIYKMIHKKSTSIVKWIFYISIIEFVVMFIPNLFADFEELRKLDMALFFEIVLIASFIVAIIFIYLFYKNYKDISVDDSTKQLMEGILKTKKTVSYYIITQLLIISVTVIISIYFTINSYDTANQTEIGSKLSFWIIMILITAVIIGLIWLFYQLLYGILLKRLKKNYKELAKNENY